MGTNFDVHLYKPGDEIEPGDVNGIVELLKIAFPFWLNLKAPIDHWKWRYFENYHGSIVTVAKKGDRIIGVDHNMHQIVRINGSVYPCTFGSETATHPDFRGMGVWAKMRESNNKYREENKIAFSYSNSENPIVIKSSQRRKRSFFPHQMIEMKRMKDTQHIDSLIKRSGFVFLKLLNRISNLLMLEPKNEVSFVIIEITKFDEDIDKFIGKTESHYNFFIEKNHEYLNWRYCDPRGGKYIIKTAVDDSEILGYVVLELMNSENGLVGNIADLLALPDRNDVAASLLRESCNYLDGLGVNSVDFGVVKGHPYQRISSSFGFIDMSIIQKMVTYGNFEKIKKEYGELEKSSPDKIYFNLGDVFLH